MVFEDDGQFIGDKTVILYLTCILRATYILGAARCIRDRMILVFLVGECFNPNGW